MIYIVTKGKKSINAEKNGNVELPRTQVFCGGLCVVRINVTKNKLYWYHGYLLVQNADSRLQTGYKMQTENLKSFYVWFTIKCHLTAYRALRNRFSAFSLHDYLHYCGKFLAHFLMKINRTIISSLQYSLLTLCASWSVWFLYRFYQRNKSRWCE